MMDKLEPDTTYQVAVASIAGRNRKRSGTVIFRTFSKQTYSTKKITASINSCIFYKFLTLSFHFFLFACHTLPQKIMLSPVSFSCAWPKKLHHDFSPFSTNYLSACMPVSISATYLPVYCRVTHFVLTLKICHKNMHSLQWRMIIPMNLQKIAEETFRPYTTAPATVISPPPLRLHHHHHHLPQQTMPKVVCAFLECVSSK